jgi:membrane carboxypeptidase/penicillin-binding protein
VLTDILTTAVNQGTGQAIRRLGYKGAVAGKTGTSNDSRDAWFAGYTPHLLTVVWVGYDDNTSTGLTGGEAAAPIWAEYMKCLGAMEPELEFIPPAGVVSREVDLSSGLLATPDCPRERVATEVFVSGTEPVTPCVAHGEFPAPTPEEVAAEPVA